MTTSTEVQAYCETCEGLVVLKDPTLKTTNQDKPYYEGACPTCKSILVAIPPAREPG